MFDITRDMTGFSWIHDHSSIFSTKVGVDVPCFLSHIFKLVIGLFGIKPYIACLIFVQSERTNVTLIHLNKI